MIYIIVCKDSNTIQKVHIRQFEKNDMLSTAVSGHTMTVRYPCVSFLRHSNKVVTEKQLIFFC